jgi:hypothetical protein
VANDPINLIDPFGLDFIHFEGTRLTWVFEKDGKQIGKRTFPAYSGGNYATKTSPPATGITEGTYYTSFKLEESTADNPKLPFEPWGPLRYKLIPDDATAARITAQGRTGGFYIHGGTVKGTLGCIEMGDYTPQQKAVWDFAKLMMNHKGSIKVRVDYHKQYQIIGGSGH